MENKKVLPIIIIGSAAILIMNSVSILLSYRIGYTNAYDDMCGATECNPSRKWL